MAIDIYLQIDGIPGESLDSAHKGWISCDSAAWAVRQPKSAVASSCGGHTAERCEHHDMYISKLADLATPLLLQYCSAGKTIGRAKLDFMRADGNGIPIKYFDIELENVLISSVIPKISEGEILSEHIAIRYSKVRWRYTVQRIGGGSGGNISGGWDLATNRVC